MSTNWPQMSSVNVPEVRHFIYKFRSIAQFTSPVLDIPYKETSKRPNSESRTSDEFRRLYSTYCKIHSRLHSHSRPLKLLYWVGDTENWMGWVSFLIYFLEMCSFRLISRI